MLEFLTTFKDREDGAVTVDWVALTAAIVGLSIAVITTIGVGAMDKTGSLGNRLTTLSIMDFE